MNQQLDRYAVMGNPVGHSKSPLIHGMFAEQTEQLLSYEAILVPQDGFADAVKQFAQAGGKGLNITLPFKEQAWQLADKRSKRAERAGAVNTLIIHPDGTLTGDNTDGVGLVNDLICNLNVAIKGARILLLGAGGAVRGVLAPLCAESPASIALANRTAVKAEKLAKEFADLGNIAGVGLDHPLLDNSFDIVINGTAAGIKAEVPTINPTSVHHAFCYDMLYGDKPTSFLQWCQQNQAAQTADGLGMLVEQAAESFFLWRGTRPDTSTVIDTLNDLRK